MIAFKAMSVLLTYPEPGWLAKLGELHATLIMECVDAARQTRPWIKHARKLRLPELQQEYIAAFGSPDAYSLYLTKHVLGDLRERSEVLMELVNRYRAHRLWPAADEPPDYLPLFLEFIATLSPRQAQREFAPYLPAVVRIRENLEQAGSPYKDVLAGLESLAAQRNRRHVRRFSLALRRMPHQAGEKPPAAFNRRRGHSLD